MLRLGWLGHLITFLFTLGYSHNDIAIYVCCKARLSIVIFGILDHNMAQITRDDVLRLAQLSKIKLSDDEIDKFVGELDAIVKYVEHIDEVDIKGFDPTDQVTGLKNVMRADEVIDYGLSAEELLKNAPDIEKNQIKAKRILN